MGGFSHAALHAVLQHWRHRRRRWVFQRNHRWRGCWRRHRVLQHLRQWRTGWRWRILQHQLLQWHIWCWGWHIWCRGPRRGWLRLLLQHLIQWNRWQWICPRAMLLLKPGHYWGANASLWVLCVCTFWERFLLGNNFEIKIPFLIWNIQLFFCRFLSFLNLSVHRSHILGISLFSKFLSWKCAHFVPLSPDY